MRILFRRLAAEDVVVDPRVDVVDDEQVDVPVAIDIGKRAAGAEDGSGSDGRLLRHVGERLAVVVVVQRIRSHVGDVEIGPAVVVVVGRAGAHAVRGDG